MSGAVHKPVVIKSKLKFKGSAGSSSGGSQVTGVKRHVEEEKSDALNKKVKSTEATADATASASTSKPSAAAAQLTKAQLKQLQRREELEKRQMEKVVNVSYRERVENFNAKLSQLTEHNDIPRISAAGNG